MPAPERPGRWLIRISEYIDCMIPNIWGKSGQIHLRYPVWYTTLEDLGIDLAALPPFKPMPEAGHAAELAEASAGLLSPPRTWPPRTSPPQAGRRHVPDSQQARVLLDAILAQFDRIPDLPAPANPLDWDEHGVPR